jgi:glycosyltransferase involved in cell wall biosynthesis
MRILMISDVYFPRVNGVSTSIQTFGRELSRLGHEVTLIAPDYGECRPEPFEILRVASRYLPLDPEDRILRPREIKGLGPMLEQRGFDLLHIHTPFVAHYLGMRLARGLGLPTVESYHTFFEAYVDAYVPLLPRSWARLAARRLTARQCNRVDALIAPSGAMLEVLRRYGVGTPCAVIPTGIDLGHFSRGDGAAFRRRHGIPAGRPTLVHVGRLAHEKNIPFLLRVLAEVRRSLPEVLLIVAGEGPARRSLEAYAARLDLSSNLRFLGYLDRGGELGGCYAAGDLFVFASRTETQGLVLLEAMALGLPVVSTAVMGTREVLVDGRGCLVAEESVEDFGAKILRLLRDGGLRRTLGDRAREYAAEWSAPVLAQRLLGLYEGVCRPPPRAPSAPASRPRPSTPGRAAPGKTPGNT